MRPPEPVIAHHQHRLRNGIIFAAVVSALVGGLVLAIPGLHRVAHRLEHASAGWIALAVVLELVSCLGYVVCFWLVFDELPRRVAARIAWAEMAFGAVVPVGGAGGFALGAWMLHERGMSYTRAADRSAVIFWLTSAVNVAALIGAGLALATGLLPGPRSPLLTIVPAVGGILVVAALLVGSASAEKIPYHRVRAACRAAAMTIRETQRLLRHPDRKLIGAIAYLGADIAVLWCCCAAIGAHPPAAALILAYLIGYLANVLLIPGGIGILDGGLIGALVLYGTSAADAATAVLTYRAIALWLPTIGGTTAFIRSRHDPHPPPTDTTRAPLIDRAGEQASPSGTPAPRRQRPPSSTSAPGWNGPAAVRAFRK